MGKRRGGDAGIDMQIQKESYQDNDEDDSGAAAPAGSFQRADASVLKTRKIRKAKRRVKGSSASGGSASNNPFAGVNILAGNNTGVTSTPFKGVNLLAGSSTSSSFAENNLEKKSPSMGSSSMFTSSKPESKPPAVPSSSIFSATKSSAVTASGKDKPDVDARKGFSFSLGKAKSSFGVFASGSSATSPGTKKPGHLVKIAALNKSFLSWVNSMPIKQSWQDGVSDYISYAEKILEEKEEQPASQTKPDSNPSETTTASPFGFSNVPSSTTITSAPQSDSSKGFSFSGSSIFGGNTQPSSTSTSIFSGQSSFSTASAPSKPTPKQDTAVAKDAEDDKVEKVETKLADDEELLHEVRAKVMWFKKQDGDGSWASKGTGQLLLLKQKGGNLRWLLMRTETTGRVTYNCPLFASLKVTVDSKSKAVSFVAVSYTEDKTGNLVAENDGKPSLFRIRVKTPEFAEALGKALEDAIPSA
eukprot:CAMPEP_0184007776 /NCGR_PEP_ID=MMETSP0954-20121128/1552_1 /TAXON_ID=627963 /ORGANISM="Aplanochytrium sp, Strain PBS07" /LENGTH=472 /DNA_ID=CAMNT_0026286705 /DNA_START=65 /DNA_END=1483 /DNA_ORIENTATION=-